MARKNKSNQYLLLIILGAVAFFFLTNGSFGSSEFIDTNPKQGMMVFYYDADGDLLEVETLGKDKSLQSFINIDSTYDENLGFLNLQSVTQESNLHQISSNVASVKLRIGVTNTGNIYGEALLAAFIDNGIDIPVDPYKIKVYPTETAIFETDPADVTPYYKENRITLLISMKPVEGTAETQESVDYRWRFYRTKPDGESCTTSEECDNLCASGICSPTETSCINGVVESGETCNQGTGVYDCGDPGEDLVCGSDQECINDVCTQVECVVDSDCSSYDGLRGSAFCGDSTNDVDGQNKDLYQYYDDYGCENNNCVVQSTSRVKQADCGDTTTGTLGSYYCNPEGIGGLVFADRTYTEKGCQSGACYSQTKTVPEQKDDCTADEYCQSGVCEPYICSEKVYDYESSSTMEADETDPSAGSCSNGGEYMRADPTGMQVIIHYFDIGDIPSTETVTFVDYAPYAATVAESASSDDGDWSVYVNGDASHYSCDRCMDWDDAFGFSRCNLFGSMGLVGRDLDANSEEYDYEFVHFNTDYDLKSHALVALDENNPYYFINIMSYDGDGEAKGRIQGEGSPNPPKLQIKTESCTIQ